MGIFPIFKVHDIMGTFKFPRKEVKTFTIFRTKELKHVINTLNH